MYPSIAIYFLFYGIYLSNGDLGHGFNPEILVWGKLHQNMLYLSSLGTQTNMSKILLK